MKPSSYVLQFTADYFKLFRILSFMSLCLLAIEEDEGVLLNFRKSMELLEGTWRIYCDCTMDFLLPTNFIFFMFFIGLTSNPELPAKIVEINSGILLFSYNLS